VKEESGTEYRLYYQGIGMDAMVKRSWKNITLLETKGATVILYSGLRGQQEIVATIRLAPGEFIEKSNGDTSMKPSRELRFNDIAQPHF